MINDLKVAAIIPARGGSKRLPRKNILELNGKPLIGWTIEAANASKYIDEVLVSTDSESIAAVALEFNASVPELRPEYLSKDDSDSISVVRYVVDKYFDDFDIIVLLQPTSPMRTSQQIDEALDVFVKNNANAVVSVTPCEHSPQWANVLPSDGNLKNFISNDCLRRSQDLETYYRLNGAIYIYSGKTIKNNSKSIYDEKSFAYIMSNKSSVDIDNEMDFKWAEFLMFRSE